MALGALFFVLVRLCVRELQSNEEFLLGYGFVLSDNANDHVSLQLAAGQNRALLSPEKRALLADSGLLGGLADVHYIRYESTLAFFFRSLALWLVIVARGPRSGVQQRPDCSY